jgi:hypothetical protein
MYKDRMANAVAAGVVDTPLNENDPKGLSENVVPIAISGDGGFARLWGGLHVDGGPRVRTLENGYGKSVRRGGIPC